MTFRLTIGSFCCQIILLEDSKLRPCFEISLNNTYIYIQRSWALLGIHTPFQLQHPLPQVFACRHRWCFTKINSLSRKHRQCHQPLKWGKRGDILSFAHIDRYFINHVEIAIKRTTEQDGRTRTSEARCQFWKIAGGWPTSSEIHQKLWISCTWISGGFMWVKISWLPTQNTNNFAVPIFCRLYTTESHCQLGWWQKIRGTWCFL